MFVIYFLPTSKNRKNVVLSSLVESFRRLPTTTPRQITQKTRCFLLILLSTTLFYETGHEVSIALLSPLRDLDRVVTFDWGSVALAYLYYGFDTIYRGVVMMCGFWHVLHVCSFTLFLFLSFASFSLLDMSPFRFGVSRLDSFEALALLASIGIFH